MTNKIVHWITVTKGISGMYSFSFSLYLKMVEMGYNVFLASSRHPDGGQLDLKPFGVHPLIPWKNCFDKNTVNIIHTDIPPCFNRLKNTVFPTHGSPYYVFLEDYLKKDHSYSVSEYLARNCSLVVTWNPKHIQYWRYFNENITYVRGGVDCKRFTPNGPKQVFLHHPTLLYCDAIRPGIKDPLNVLFASKILEKEIDDIRLELFNIPLEHSGLIHYIIGSLNLGVTVENVVIGAIPQISKYYRGADIVFNLVRGGSISSVGCEAMACGTPVILLEGEPWNPALMKCKDTPEDIAKAVIKLWDKMRENPEKMRKKARQIALKYYNIENTVRKLVEIFENNFNLHLSIDKTVSRNDT